MKNLLVITLIFLSTILFAQTNLVPNHDFNKIGKKVKEKGQINMAEPWISPTLTQADLYIKNTKSAEIAVDGNMYGAEAPMEGDNYAGILAYSYKGKASRSYLQVKLTEPLKQDVEYCVTFHVSLADLSKYACNYLGAYLSNDAVSANNNDVFQFEPQIISRRLTVYEQQYYWIPVCSKYKAKGGEEFLTIGNFTPEEKLAISKIKRPQGFNSPQTNDAYYYIDNVIDGFSRMITLLSEDKKRKLNGKSFALKSKNRMTLKELAELFEKTTGKKLNIAWGKKPYRLREVMRPWTRGKSIPGWKQKISTEEGIKKTFKE